MRYIATLFLLVLFTCAVKAEVAVYDNTAAFTNGADPVQDFGPLFDSFTPTVNGSLSDLQVLLSGDNNSLGSVSLDLYSDISTAPGDLIANLAVLPDSALGSSISSYDFSMSVHPELAGGTRYWIGLSGRTTADWAWSDDISGIGVGSEFVDNVSGLYANVDSGPYQMSVSVTPTSPADTPEPATAVLVIAGIGLFGLCNRLFRKSYSGGEEKNLKAPLVY